MQRKNFDAGRRMIWIALLLMAGCAPLDTEDSTKPLNYSEIATSLIPHHEKLMAANPCGALRVRRPFLNVTGSVTNAATANASISLYIAPDASLNTSLFVVDNCPPIKRVSIAESRHFNLGPLPQGSYVIMLNGHSSDRSRGLPFVHETNASNLSLEMAFYGGDSRHSLAAFSIRSGSNAESPRAENQK